MIYRLILLWGFYKAATKNLCCVAQLRLLPCRQIINIHNAFILVLWRRNIWQIRFWLRSLLHHFSQLEMHLDCPSQNISQGSFNFFLVNTLHETFYHLILTANHYLTAAYRKYSTFLHTGKCPATMSPQGLQKLFMQIACIHRLNLQLPL